ncbi:hypothetical protein AAEI00_15365 [Shewanella algae]|uniref:hypothetical protein n=1 Tax=Shewanella algae TaxID=38313 RepID=UPI00318FD9FB
MLQALNGYINIEVNMKVDLSDLLPSIKKSEFQKRLRSLLNENVEGLSWDEKLALVNSELSKLDAEFNSEPENKGKPWSDHELRLVLNMAPTRESVMLLAKALKRGHGSIEQIYRWAGQSPDRIESERSDHAFVQQIVRIRKELGWKSVGGNK